VNRKHKQPVENEKPKANALGLSKSKPIVPGGTENRFPKKGGFTGCCLSFHGSF
jgi:hypothetical protein